jgi:hypothetical protein
MNKEEVQRQYQNTPEIKPLIGQDIYDVAEVTVEGPRAFYEDMRETITPELAKSLQSRLHNNSYKSGDKYFGDKRPASSYYTLMDGRVLIEWGMIDPTGEAKLHDYLNREINVIERFKHGAIVRSGHIADITLPGREDEVRVALFDSIASDQRLDKESPEFDMTMTLLNHNVLPVTTGGFPIAFEDYQAPKVEGGE